MIDRSLRVRDDLVADSASYNMLLTTLLRTELGPAVWGNWTLDQAVEPGMAGVLDPVAGTFELHKYGAIPLDVSVREEPVDLAWDFGSPSVARDAAAGTWTFAESNTIASQGRVASRRAVVDPVQAARDQFDQLHRWALARGWATDDGILQGFGMVTATYEAERVVNLASRAAGHVVDCATGRLVDDPDVEAHRHPREPVGARATVPVGFEFLSYSGHTVLPGWVGLVPSISVSFHNGGTYVVQCTVSYDAGGRVGLRKQVKLSGGLPRWVDLPLDATNVGLACRFWHVDDWGPEQVLPSVASPLEAWWQGQGSVDIEGWWPGDYGVDWAA